MLVKQYNSHKNLFEVVFLFRKSPKSQHNTKTGDTNYAVPPDTCTFSVYVYRHDHQQL